MNIADLTNLTRRELDQRAGGGLEITLYWHPEDNRTSVEVYHLATEETISFPVPAAQALDAFHHPFAHLAELDAGLTAIDVHEVLDEALIFGEGGVQA
jgi:hypothetical protein